MSLVSIGRPLGPSAKSGSHSAVIGSDLGR